VPGFQPAGIEELKAVGYAATAALRAIDELFNEMGKGPAAHWDIVNAGLLGLEKLASRYDPAGWAAYATTRRARNQKVHHG
jgi:hypothetical protein